MPNKEIEILLIEDNPDEAELAIQSLALRRLADKLLHIDDGAEALEFVSSIADGSRDMTGINLKLILLDLKLSKVDGFEILKKLKSSALSSIIPVVILTSSAENKDISEGYRLGANSYIVKPVSFDNFDTAIGAMSSYWLNTNQHPHHIK